MSTKPKTLIKFLSKSPSESKPNNPKQRISTVMIQKQRNYIRYQISEPYRRVLFNQLPKWASFDNEKEKKATEPQNFPSLTDPLFLGHMGRH